MKLASRLITFTAILWASCAHGTTLLTFDTKAPDTLADQTTLDAGAGTDGILHGSIEPATLRFGQGLAGKNQYPGRFTTSGIHGQSISESIANESYYAFTVTPKDNGILNCSKITLRLFFQAGEGNTYSWGLYSSATGYMEADELIGVKAIDGATGVYQYDIDLASITKLQNSATPIEFRIVVTAPNPYLTAGLSDDTLAPWPNSSAIVLEGTVK